MRVAAQLIYFYSGGTPAPQPVEVEDSRRYPVRRPAFVALRSLSPLEVVVGRMVVSTRSAMVLQPLSAALQLRSAVPATSARAALGTLRLSAVASKLKALTKSLATLSPLDMYLEFSKTVVGTSSAALLGTLETRASMRALGVQIGPDQVKQQDEELIEILFLSDLLQPARSNLCRTPSQNL